MKALLHEAEAAADDGLAWLQSESTSVNDVLKALRASIERMDRCLHAEHRAYAGGAWGAPGSRRERRAAERAAKRQRQAVMT